MARPQQVSDDAIVAIIEELRQPHRAPSGVAVREQLWARFGIRASTQRVYRLLKRPPRLPPPLDLDPADAARQIADLTAERDAALRRAELAEYRERATQDRTANQIDSLRQRLKRFGADPYA
jgi:hypothetical protein